MTPVGRSTEVDDLPMSAPDTFVERMRRSSHLSAGNVAYIEQLYEAYLDDR